MFFWRFRLVLFPGGPGLRSLEVSGAGMQLPTRLAGPVFGVGGCQRVMPKIGQVTGHFLLFIVKIQ